MKNYHDRACLWALILGGSSGIGLATAKKLAIEGFNILIVHRDRRSSAEGIEKEFDIIRNTGVKLVTRNVNALAEKGRQAIINELPEILGNTDSIRLFLHSISRGNLKPLAPLPIKKPNETLLTNQVAEGLESLRKIRPSENDEQERVLLSEDFQLTIHAMAISLWEWANELIKGDFFAEDARVISLTSEGNQKAWRGYAAVSAAKVAIEAISRSMALELAPFGIRTNVVQAGITDTPSLRMIPGSDLMKALAIKRNPFKRLTTPEDVANVISLLCRDESSWINGALIPVDGGERIV